MPGESPKLKFHYGEIFTSAEKRSLAKFCDPLGITIDTGKVRDVDLMEICDYLSQHFFRSGVALGGDIGKVFVKAELAKQQMIEDVENLAIEDLPVKPDERLPDYMKRYLEARKNFPVEIRIKMAESRLGGMLDENRTLKKLDPENNTDIGSLDIIENMLGSFSYFSQTEQARSFGDEKPGHPLDMKGAWNDFYIQQLEARKAIIIKSEEDEPAKLARVFSMRLGDAGKA